MATVFLIPLRSRPHSTSSILLYDLPRALNRTAIFSTSSSSRRTMSSSSVTLSTYLVTPAQLNSALQKNIHSRLSTAPRIIPVSAAWYLPNDPQKRTGHASFISKRIPRSRFFDLDKIKDDTSPYPHMLPSPEVFAREVSQMGINRDDTVVVYDAEDNGLFSAPRVAWTFRVFGHQDVHVLNNFKIWVRDGYPVEEGEPTDYRRITEYPVPEMDKHMVVAFDEVKETVKDRAKEGAKVQILDARPEGRWKGTADEPRKGLSSGHMPGSSSLPHSAVLDPETGALLPPSELQKIFKQRGVSKDDPIISSCGTGVTATVIDLALGEAGFTGDTRRVYDGSWTEWAQRVEPEEGLIVKE